VAKSAGCSVAQSDTGDSERESLSITFVRASVEGIALLSKID
jgi:hypothetical protein